MTIRTARIHRPAGAWPKQDCGGSLTLDFDSRHRRRIRLPLEGGETILLDLPQAVAMADGDGLLLDDGSWLEVRAAPEHIVEVTHSDPGQLLRIAWHLGNRHLPAQIQHGVLRIRPDHVIESMLRGLGAQLRKKQLPFQPEGGAYGGHTHESRDGGDASDAGHAEHHHG